MSRRAVLTLTLVLASCGPRPTPPTPTRVDCHVVTWAGTVAVEPFTATSADGGSFTPRLDACDCGFSPGIATCTFNPSTERFDGRCRSCQSRYCLSPTTALPVQHGGACPCAASSGSWSCTLQGDPASCACPEACVGAPDASTWRGLTCRCDGGAPEWRCGADGGPVVCACPPAPGDAGSDGGADAGSDGGADAGSDGGADAGSDGGADAGSDGGADAGSDGGSDAGSDAGP